MYLLPTKRKALLTPLIVLAFISILEAKNLAELVPQLSCVSVIQPHECEDFNLKIFFQILIITLPLSFLYALGIENTYNTKKGLLRISLIILLALSFIPVSLALLFTLEDLIFNV